jgi:uncharacterized protein YndB with AHSA1/START domain
MITNFIATYKTIINAPIEKVWDALTKTEIVKLYFFGTNQQTTWEIGSPISWEGEYDGKSFRDVGVVLEYKKNSNLKYSYLSNWSGLPDLPENYLSVEYIVKSIGKNTELTVNQANYNEEKQKESLENWEYLINDLKKVVE